MTRWPWSGCAPGASRSIAGSASCRAASRPRSRSRSRSPSARSVLILDEPAAALDPLARREFLQALMEAVVERELTVLMSSHLLADLERVCDRLVVLAAGGVQLTGPIDEIVASHRLLVGPPGEDEAVARVHQVVQTRHTPRQTVLLVRANGHVYDARWQIEDVALEDIVLAYLQHPDQEVAS